MSNDTTTRIFDKLDEQTKALHIIDNKVTALSCNCQTCQAKVEKIDELEAEINKIKRDRWWIGSISAAVGWIVGILISWFK